MSSNEPSLGINSVPSSPSGFQHFLPSIYSLHNLQLVNGNSSSESLSIPLEQKRYDRLNGSRKSNNENEQMLYDEPTPISTGSEFSQSAIVAGFSQEQKCKSRHLIPLHTSSEYSSFCYDDSEIKNYNGPTCTKRRKMNSTPEELKDDKYWDRRQRNNLAAKKSRDAKRRHEDFMIQRATFLEIENSRLRLELSCLREQNERIKKLIC